MDHNQNKNYSIKIDPEITDDKICRPCLYESYYKNTQEFKGEKKEDKEKNTINLNREVKTIKKL